MWPWVHRIDLGCYLQTCLHDVIPWWVWRDARKKKRFWVIESRDMRSVCWANAGTEKNETQHVAQHSAARCTSVHPFARLRVV